MKVDLLVLGTGPAGGTVASKCAAGGLRVAIAENREFGGTCALRGCNPKKVLVRAAEVQDWARRARGCLLDEESRSSIDWPALMRFKSEFTDPVPEKSEASFEEAGITTLHGPTRFLGPDRVEVGETEVEAAHVCVATGSRPVPLDIEGGRLAITSDDFLDLDELPEEIVFVGGGYIAFEFAHVAARAGARCVVIERDERPLGGFDPDLVERLVERSREVGIEVRSDTEVHSIARGGDGDGDGYDVRVRSGGSTETVRTRRVVHAAGRAPALDGLDLETGEVAHGPEGIEVDSFLRSVSNPRVYAAGDCAANGVGKLTPAANEDARVIVKALTDGENRPPEYGAIPSAVFTVPSLARVGLSEARARERCPDLEVRQGDQSSWGSIRKVCESSAAYKILVDKASDRILGAHLLGPGAAETINLFALAMRGGMTARDVKATLMVFPTFASDVRSML